MLAALSIAGTIRNLATLFVRLEALDIGRDVDAVATDDTLETAVADVFFRLTVAPNDRGERGILLSTLNTAMNDLRCFDHITVLIDAFRRSIHSGND